MPERLHKVILLNPPLVFKVMLDALRPLLDSATLGKVVTLRGPDDAILASLADEHAFDPLTVQWLETVLATPPSAPLPPLPAAAAEMLLPGLRGVYACQEVQRAAGDETHS